VEKEFVRGQRKTYDIFLIIKRQLFYFRLAIYAKDNIGEVFLKRERSCNGLMIAGGHLRRKNFFSLVLFSVQKPDSVVIPGDKIDIPFKKLYQSLHILVSSY